MYLSICTCVYIFAAHPPIHPVKAVELADLENDEERGVYELITRHFLACCAQDAKGSQTKIKVEIPLGGEVKHDHMSSTRMRRVVKTFVTITALLCDGADDPRAELDECL